MQQKSLLILLTGQPRFVTELTLFRLAFERSLIRHFGTHEIDLNVTFRYSMWDRNDSTIVDKEYISQTLISQHLNYSKNPPEINFIDYTWCDDYIDSLIHDIPTDSVGMTANLHRKMPIDFRKKIQQSISQTVCRTLGSYDVKQYDYVFFYRADNIISIQSVPYLLNHGVLMDELPKLVKKSIFLNSLSYSKLGLHTSDGEAFGSGQAWASFHENMPNDMKQKIVNIFNSIDDPELIVDLIDPHRLNWAYIDYSNHDVSLYPGLKVGNFMIRKHHLSLIQEVLESVNYDIEKLIDQKIMLHISNIVA